VIAHCRYWMAAAVGTWMVAALPAQIHAQSGGTALPSPDQVLADTIGNSLRQSGNLHHYNVSVSVSNGTAQVTGTVADQNQRDEAIRIVQGVPGIERVRDGLALAGQVRQTQALDLAPPSAEPAPIPRQETGAPPLAPTAEPTPLVQAAPSPYDLNPPHMPPYAWPTYAPYDNYSRVAYPTLYPYQAWPYVGPFYPFPKVPLGWRKVKLEWQDGFWWYASNSNSHDWWRLRFW
jgi:hypothetical protein